MNQNTCPQCGTALKANAAFCGKCGAQIATQPGDTQTVVYGHSQNPPKYTTSYETQNIPPAAVLPKAGFGTRLVAYLIDFIILTVIQLVVVKLAPDLAVAANIIITAAYFIALIGRDGQTFGKKVMGIKVIVADGNVPGYTKALIRYIGYFISSLILGLGYLLILFHKDRQALHDVIAGTYVVKIAHNG